MVDNVTNTSELSDIKLTLKEHHLLLKIVSQCRKCTNKFNAQLESGGQGHSKETETPYQATQSAKTKAVGNHEI
jgi:hypothetical protein